MSSEYQQTIYSELYIDDPQTKYTLKRYFDRTEELRNFEPVKVFLLEQGAIGMAYHLLEGAHKLAQMDPDYAPNIMLSPAITTAEEKTVAVLCCRKGSTGINELINLFITEANIMLKKVGFEPILRQVL